MLLIERLFAIRRSKHNMIKILNVRKSLTKEMRQSYVFLYVFGFLQLLGIGMEHVLTPLYARDLGASYELVGIIVSSYWIARLFVELPLGYASNRISGRLLLVLSFLLAGISSLFYGFADTPVFLFPARCLWGIATAMFLLASLAFLTEFSATRRSETAFGIFQSLDQLGLIIGSSVGGALATFLGYPLTFTFCSVFLFASAIALLQVRALEVQARIPFRKNLRITGDFGRILRTKELMFVNVSVFFAYFVNSSMIQFAIPLYAKDHLGMVVAEIGVLISSRSVGAMAGAFLTKHLVDLSGRGRALAISFVLYAVPLLAFVFMGSYSLLLVLMAVVGLSNGFSMTLFPVLVAENAPAEAVGMCMGLYRTFLDLGGLLGSVISAVIAEFWGLDTTFYVASLILTLAIPFALRSSGRKRH